MNQQSKVTDHGNIMIGHANGIMAQVFGAEWHNLNESDAHNVCVDFLDAANEDGVGAREYQRRIGTGNLQSYANCLSASRKRYQS